MLATRAPGAHGDRRWTMHSDGRSEAFDLRPHTASPIPGKITSKLVAQDGQV